MQNIQVIISGEFPNYVIGFSAAPSAVAFSKTKKFHYTFATEGFAFRSVNQQCSPFDTEDSLTWAITADGLNLQLTDINSDEKPSVFGLEFEFSDKQGNRFSSPDPQVRNDGRD